MYLEDTNRFPLKLFRKKSNQYPQLSFYSSIYDLNTDKIIMGILFRKGDIDHFMQHFV